MNAPELMQTAGTLVTSDKGLLALDVPINGDQTTEYVATY